MAFQIPSSTLFHSLLHSKHPIVSSQKRNRYTHSLKDTCRGTWRSKVSKCKEERLWFFYQKLLKYKNCYDIKVTIKGYYFVVNSDEIKLFLLLNQYEIRLLLFEISRFNTLPMTSSSNDKTHMWANKSNYKKYNKLFCCSNDLFNYGPHFQIYIFNDRNISRWCGSNKSSNNVGRYKSKSSNKYWNRLEEVSLPPPLRALFYLWTDTNKK